MNDFDFDCKEKKRIARGAFAKKGGSRSKKCTLPGDYLTPAQKAKLSTTLVAVNLRKPMTYEQFKRLPTDVKREYLEYLRDEYGATRKWVAIDMFRMSNNGFRLYIAEHEPTLVGLFPPMGRYAEATRERWLRFVNGETEPAEEEPAPEPETEEPEPEEVPNPPHRLSPNVEIRSGSFTVTGPALEALTTLTFLFGDNRRSGTFTLAWTYGEERA